MRNLYLKKCEAISKYIMHGCILYDDVKETCLVDILYPFIIKGMLLYP